MNSTIEHHLAMYIAKRRIVALLRSVAWCCVVVAACLALPRSYRLTGSITGAVMMVSLLGRPVAQLFGRYNRVAAAIEIEARWPEFDQRLITVASEQSAAPLLDHLRLEVETILNTRRKKTRVSLRPLLIPVLVLVVIAIIFKTHPSWIHHSKL